MMAGSGLAADDPGGWDKARWGMTEAQVLRAFGPEASRSDGRIMVKPFHLSGVPFQAFLTFGKAGILDGVLLAPVDHADESPPLFDSLAQLLVQKYGRPWTTRDGALTQIQWTLRTTVITLVHFKTYITIQYRPKPSEPRL